VRSRRLAALENALTSTDARTGHRVNAAFAGRLWDGLWDASRLIGTVTMDSEISDMYRLLKAAPGGRKAG
jgi:hypothetical protein